MLITLLIFYFLSILVLSFIKIPALQNFNFSFFKIFFPSWKFFDENINTPVLYYRLKSDASFTDWIICFPPPKTKWWQIFFNPAGNFYLAHHSHIQQLMAELSMCEDNKLSEFHQTSSYKITENFVRFKLRSMSITSDFQFKLSDFLDNEENNIIISPILKVPIE